MNTNNRSLAHLSDDQLLVRVKELVRQDRVTTARLLAHLGEMEERKLYCREACSSLFTYCVEVLHLSEPAAYRRVKAARLARRFPVVLEMLADGSIHLAALDVLAAHLTDDNHRALLAEARHKTKREVEELAAHLRPLPDVTSVVRKLPEPRLREIVRAASPVPEVTITKLSFKTGAGEAPPPGPGVSGDAPLTPQPAKGSRPSVSDPNPGHRSVIAPLSPARYRIQFTAGAETYRKLRQVQELMRHRVPDGDPAAIVDTALTVLLEKLLGEKTRTTTRPRRNKQSARKSTAGKHGSGPAPGSGEENHEESSTPGTGEAPRRRAAAGKPNETRHIPAAVKRAVWRRDGGRCAFTTPNGRRCSSRGSLEYHHVEPYMLGGRATIGNIALRCRAHNEYEGELQFGKRRSRVPGVKTPNRPETLPGESLRAFGSHNYRKLSPERVAGSDNPRTSEPARADQVNQRAPDG
jgi:5-methylcytosine-specific restriction endonuclease McrA